MMGAQKPEIALSAECDGDKIPFGGDITVADDRVAYYGKLMDAFERRGADMAGADDDPDHKASPLRPERHRWHDRTRPLLAAACLILLSSGGILALLSNTDETMSETPPTAAQADELPVVRAAVGTTLHRVRAASTYAFDFSGRDDNADFIIEKPVVFEYGGGPADDSLWFRLPPTRFVWLAQDAGVVHSITTTPQLQFTDLDGAYRLAQRIAETIDATTWPRAESEPVTEAELRRIFADPETRETARLTLGLWQVGDVEVYVELKRRFVAGSNRAQAAGVDEDSYLVQVGINDPGLSTRLTGRVYERREAAGDRYQALPLSVWLDEQD